MITRASERSDAEQGKIFAHFVTHVHPPSRDLFHQLDGELAALKKERGDVEKASTATTMVMVEMQKRKPAYVLMRGDFRQPGEEVQPDVPAIFPRLPED